MLTDQQGNGLPGATVEAAAPYEVAVHRFNIYQGDPIPFLDQAIEAAPRFAMAHIAKAYMYGLATEPGATADARAIVTGVQSLSLNARETSHVAALKLLLEGQWGAAAIALDRHNALFPRDILALQAGHLVDFYRAGARNLRDRIARVLPKWSASVPGYSILLGMYAFGLEECGSYDEAEEYGREAVARQPLDCWAHHAVAHVMEMQGRVEDGIGWMIAREPYWSGEDNVFKVHNWWHRALCHLYLGEGEEVLALYDGPIRAHRSSVALELIDASALLWRLCLTEHDVGDRWEELATAWDQHADGKTYPFNDWHAIMAYLGAGREREVERLLSAFQTHGSGNSEVSRWATEVGLPLAQGFAAFWHGDYSTATELLFGARMIVNSFGGSHAQRDIIDWTLVEAALRGGQRELAEMLANERLALRPHNPVNLSFLARARADAPHKQATTAAVVA